MTSELSLSGGILSNLETWENGNSRNGLVNQDGRDVWEIEITGSQITK